MALLAVCAWAPAAFALGDVMFPGRTVALWPARHATVEVADAELFGVAGLRASGVRASAPLWRFVAAVELVRVGSDVASESRATLRLATGAVAVELSVERAQAGTRTAGLSAIGVMARLPVGRHSRVLFYAGGLGVRGSYDPGFDAAIDIQLQPVPAVVLDLGVALHRRYGETLRLSVEVRAATPLALSAGYDAATETAGAAVRVSMRALSVEVGASVHAVLGASQRVSLRWSR
jgi:hypothetical protein